MKPDRLAPLDIAECETEPLANIGAVQAPNHLLVLSPDTGRLLAASEGAASLLGVTQADLTAASSETLLGSRTLDWLRRASAGSGPGEAFVALPFAGPLWASAFDAGVGPALLLDPEESGMAADGFEPATALSALGRIGADFRTALASEGLASPAPFAAMADTFRGFSGFDRVMVYRFDADMNGRIIAESDDGTLPEGFLGLTFPSSDIPAPARALFLRNRVRPTTDVAAASTPVRALVPGLDAAAIDLAACPSRAVSPVHLRYLANMGVRASLVIALIVGGRLWGLLSCHHYDGPRRLSRGATALCHAFCDLASMAISEAQERRDRRSAAEMRRIVGNMRKQVLAAPEAPEHEGLAQDFGDDLLDVIDADGLVLTHPGGLIRIGATPPAELAQELLHRSRAQAAEGSVFVTNHLAGHWPDLAADLLPGSAGAVFVGHASSDRGLLALRRAHPGVTEWAGNPDKRVGHRDPGDMLTPRNSFGLWEERTRDRSRPWESEDSATIVELASGLDELLWLIDRRIAERALVRAHEAAERARREVQHAAFHDALTGLPNRRALERLLDSLAGAKDEPDRLVGALHIDLDRFKQINDTLGHAAGDAVLTHVARTLDLVRRDTDAAFRVGGDEFLIIVPRVGDVARLGELADRLIAELSRPVEAEGETCRFGASVGIATERAAALVPSDLLARADIALYESKEASRGRHRFVTDEMVERRKTRRALGEDVLRALENDEFAVFYQLQFDARTLAPVGAEALVRWHHPERGLVLPDAFLPAAEDVGVIEKVDQFVMSRALSDRESWARAGWRVPRVSVNVSARRLSEPGLADMMRDLSLEAGALTFELLETIDLDELDQTRAWTLDTLREAGVRLEIDDFGTGHTSILGMIRLRPDAVKIDRALVRPLGHSDGAEGLICSIVEMTRPLGIEVAAEGVETEDQIRLLRELGCDILQGYGLARPMAAARVAPFLADMSRRRGTG